MYVLEVDKEVKKPHAQCMKNFNDYKYQLRKHFQTS